MEIRNARDEIRMGWWEEGTSEDSRQRSWKGWGDTRQRGGKGWGEETRMAWSEERGDQNN